MNFLKSLKPELIIASVFAFFALLAVIAGQVYHNPYFIVAAGVLVVATYITHPPYWVAELTRMAMGKKSEE